MAIRSTGAALITLIVATTFGQVAQSDTGIIDVTATLQRYCNDCHGPEKQKGERRFDTLRYPLQDHDSAILTQDIIDQLVQGDMPPKKADPLAEKTRLNLIARLNAEKRRFHETANSTGGEVVLRRLNQREYRNTVRDLLGINLQMFDPAIRFPREQTVEHFDNVGDVLTTSGYLLEQYLDAADQVVEKAFSPLENPSVQSWRFTAPFTQQPELVTAHKKAFDSRFLCLHETINSDRHWGEYAPILKFSEGVPHHGRYEIELLLEAKDRDHPHPSSRVDIDKDEPMWLGVVPGNAAFGELHEPQPMNEVLAKIAIPDGEPKWHKTSVWLDKGFTPRFIYLNGPSGARNLHSSIGLKLLKAEGRGNNPFGQHYIKTLREGKLPHIRIHEIKIRGPIFEQWPPASQRTVLGASPFSPERLPEIIRSFATRAYRRPVTDEEHKRLMAFANQRQASGRAPFDAMKDTLKSILCAPAFLYLDERTAIPGKPLLTDWSIANRLSYFLWSSTPDAELVKAVRDGNLTSGKALREQSARMLADPKAEAFYEGFLDSWLTLRDLGGMPPDRQSFGIYYDKDLRPLMLKETRLFTRHLMEENLSLLNFLDSDFTIVNKTLARFYGLPPMAGYEFQKVSLPNRRRGGLLGQAGILTVTANGIETSPVTRGVWTLENILGTPPPPPPDNVEPLDPDIRGAATIREQLAKHRDVPACNECHRRIDPNGFPLENFDPIGRWRDRYASKKPIDASGELANGDTYEDITGFKEILLKNEDRFARTVIEKLLTYGTGRRMEGLDRPEVDRLVAASRESGFRLRDTLMHVIESPILRSR
ncbi:MAG: DUF1592 domain-containing protein [Verrucomicrobiae bacterium]|jgi:hypothetical protein|nr:DUF1592 domain-containing protein [Verrucomicrobiae bacterium]